MGRESHKVQSREIFLYRLFNQQKQRCCSLTKISSTKHLLAEKIFSFLAFQINQDEENMTDSKHESWCAWNNFFFSKLRFLMKSIISKKEEPVLNSKPHHKKIFFQRWDTQSHFAKIWSTVSGSLSQMGHRIEGMSIPLRSNSTLVEIRFLSAR